MIEQCLLIGVPLRLVKGQLHSIQILPVSLRNPEPFMSLKAFELNSPGLTRSQQTSEMKEEAETDSECLA